jgi:hypothetical protein
LSGGAHELAKRLNWEPPGHDDYPGSIPDWAWDHWREFIGVAEQPIAWRSVDARAWRTLHAADWSPTYEAEAGGRQYVLVQHDWHGFPDPPEWALHVMETDSGTARCLGCFDTWPEAWTGGSGR